MTSIFMGLREDQIFDEVVARLGESETLEEFQHAVRPFKPTIMTSPLFPNARAEGSIEPPFVHDEEYKAITLEMWNEYWSEHL
jgi:hypothetical protein